MTVPRPLIQNNYVFDFIFIFFFQFRKTYVSILCLGDAMSHSIRLFKPVLKSGAIASHVLGGTAVGVVWNTPQGLQRAFGVWQLWSVDV